MFNPSALHLTATLLAEEGEISPIEQTRSADISRILGADVERKCSSLKLASRIIGLATGSAATMNDNVVLSVMADLLSRLNEYRRYGLSLVSISAQSPAFPLVFNSVTSSMLDAVTEEWRWSNISQDRSRRLPMTIVGQLMDLLIRLYPERFTSTPDESAVSLDAATVRRLAVLECIPKIYTLMNFFDYYHTDKSAMSARLMRAVADQAEAHTNVFMVKANNQIGYELILRQMYLASASVMCEAYKSCAAIDVEGLRQMPSLERSVVVSQYERTGMSYDHVLDSHASAMDKMADTADMILESRQKQA